MNGLFVSPALLSDHGCLAALGHVRTGSAAGEA